MPTDPTQGKRFLCQRLSFGVPLEDVFPQDEIHPGLKDILSITYESIAKTHYSVKNTLNHLQGSVQERFKLKERLVSCNEFSGLKVSPGALLWVVRHFIGLLPTSLVPSYADGQKYCWKNLSKDCQLCLINYATRGRYNKKLTRKIAEELLRLPWPNFLLLATLLNFLRMLAVLPGGEPKINKTSVFMLVKYFSSAIFLRPFRPGWITKIDKQYYPLTLYLIIKWPELREIFIKTSKYRFALPLDEIYPGFKTNGYPPECPYYLYKTRRDGTTQTTAISTRKTKPKPMETLVRVVPPSYHDFDFLRDVACQTEGLDDSSNDLEEEQSGFNEANKHVICIHKDCCCTYSSNYAGQTSNVNSMQEIQNDLDSGQRYGWNTGENLDATDRMSSTLFSPLSEFSESPNYSYDNYSRFNLICDGFVYEKVKQFDPIEKQDKCLQNEALKEKVSKIGWCYESPVWDKTLTEPGSSSNKSDCSCDVRRSLNEELKQKLKSMRIMEESEKEASSYDGEDAKSVGEEERRPISKSKLSKIDSKRSLVSVSKIKSRLDFLRVFGVKKAKTKKSSSCEQVDSRVKYEKMGSVSSVL